MRRDKATARILLILSVVHAAVATPAIVRQRSLEDVTAALEKRGNSDDESYPSPHMGNDLPLTSGTWPSPDDPPPESGTLQLHNELPQTSEAPPSPDGTPPISGTPQSQDDLPVKSGALPLQHDGPPGSGTLQPHNDSPSTSGAPSSQDDTPPVLGDPQFPNDPSAGSEDPELHDDPSPWWLHTNWRPPGEVLQGESSGTTELPTSSSEIPPLHDGLSLQHTNFYPPEEMLQGEFSGTSSTTSGVSQLQNHLPPGTSQVHSASDGSGDDDTVWRWLYDSRINGGASSSSDFNSEEPLALEAPPPAPEADTFSNDALKQKLKRIADFGAVAGVSVVATLVVQKVIKDYKNGVYVSAFFPASLADILLSHRVTNILTHDLAQSTHWQGSCS